MAQAADLATEACKCKSSARAQIYSLWCPEPRGEARPREAWSCCGEGGGPGWSSWTCSRGCPHPAAWVPASPCGFHQDPRTFKRGNGFLPPWLRGQDTGFTKGFRENHLSPGSQIRLRVESSSTALFSFWARPRKKGKGCLPRAAISPPRPLYGPTGC